MSLQWRSRSIGCDLLVKPRLLGNGIQHDLHAQEQGEAGGEGAITCDSPLSINGIMWGYLVPGPALGAPALLSQETLSPGQLAWVGAAALGKGLSHPLHRCAYA